MNKLPERIRIKDIARLADVSVGTVDRVLHGRTGVSEASRKRVEEILKQLDYQPNMGSDRSLSGSPAWYGEMGGEPHQECPAP